MPINKRLIFCYCLHKLSLVYPCTVISYLIRLNLCVGVFSASIQKLSVPKTQPSSRNLVYNLIALWEYSPSLGLQYSSSFGNQTTKDEVAMLDEYTINTNENSFVNHHPRWLPCLGQDYHINQKKKAIFDMSCLSKYV